MSVVLKGKKDQRQYLNNARDEAHTSSEQKWYYGHWQWAGPADHAILIRLMLRGSFISGCYRFLFSFQISNEKTNAYY
jgi:hypothetical protein